MPGLHFSLLMMGNKNHTGIKGEEKLFKSDWGLNSAAK